MFTNNFYSILKIFRRYLQLKFIMRRACDGNSSSPLVEPRINWVSDESYDRQLACVIHTRDQELLQRLFFQFTFDLLINECMHIIAHQHREKKTGLNCWGISLTFYSTLYSTALFVVLVIINTVGFFLKSYWSNLSFQYGDTRAAWYYKSILEIKQY